MIGAEEAVQRALVAALSDEGMPIFDGAAVRAPFPYLTIGDAIVADWSGKGFAGREVRTAVTAWDEAGNGARLHATITAVEAAVATIARDLEGGWRIASLAFVRSRIVRDGVRPWAGMVEHRVRVARANW